MSWHIFEGALRVYNKKILILTEMGSWKGGGAARGSVGRGMSCKVFDTPGNPYGRGRPSMVDLLVLSCLNQLIFILKIVLPLLQNKLS
jgi:hypothetical protein